MNSYIWYSFTGTGYTAVNTTLYFRVVCDLVVETGNKQTHSSGTLKKRNEKGKSFLSEQGSVATSLWGYLLHLRKKGKKDQTWHKQRDSAGVKRNQKSLSWPCGLESQIGFYKSPNTELVLATQLFPCRTFAECALAQEARDGLEGRERSL